MAKESTESSEKLNFDTFFSKEMFDTLPDAAIIVDREGRFLAVNNAAEELSGYKRDELIGESFMGVDILGEKDLFNAVKGFTAAKSGVKGKTEPSQLIRKDKSRVWVEMISYPIKDNGEITKFMTIVRDISESKKAEEKYRSLIENTKEPVFSVGKGGRFIFMNSFAAAMLGGKSDDLIGKTMYDLFPKDIADKQMTNILNVFQTKQALRTESSSLVRGEERWFDTSLWPVMLRGDEVDYVQAIAHDVTDRKNTEKALKESEEKYRDLFEHAGDAIFITDKNRDFVGVNDKAADMLDYTKEDILKMNVEDIYADKNELGNIDKDMAQLIRGENIFLKMQLLGNGDKLVDSEVMIRLISKEPVRLMAIARNITEINGLQKKLKKLSKRKIPLTPKERKVMYALSHNFDRSDQKIADSVGVKRPTVTAIKNKLLNERYITPYSIVCPRMLGCNMYVITHCRLNPNKSNKEAFADIEKPDHAVFVAATNKDLIFIALGEDYPKASSAANQFVKQFEANGMIESSKDYYVPIEDNNTLKMMHFSGIVREALSLDILEEPVKFRCGEEKLTPKEKKILTRLVEVPTATDVDLSKTTGISRPKISTFKTELAKKGKLFSVCVPDFGKIGVKLIALNIFNFKEDVDESTKNSFRNMQNSAMAMTSLKEIVSISSYSSFERYKLDYENLNRDIMEKTNSKASEILLPVDDLTYFNIDFASLVKYKLEKD